MKEILNTTIEKQEAKPDDNKRGLANPNYIRDLKGSRDENANNVH